MARSLFTLLLVLTFRSVLGQEISRQDINSSLKLLAVNSPELAQLDALLKLAEFNVRKLGEHKEDLDSTVLFLNQANRINDKIKSPAASGYIALIESYLAKDRNQLDRGKDRAQEAIEILNKTDSYYRLGNAYYHLAAYYNIDNENETFQKIQLLENGVKAFKKAGAIEKEAFGYKMLGEAYDDPKISLNKLRISLSLYQSIRYKQVQGIYDLMAVASLSDLDMQRALNYSLLALKTAESVQDTTMQLSVINNHIGIIYLKKRDFKNAVIYFLKALRTAEVYTDRSSIYLLTDNIVNAYIRDDKPFFAKNLLERTLKKYPFPKDDIQLNRNYASAFVKIYTRLHQRQEAMPYVKMLGDIMAQNKLSNDQLIDDYMNLAMFYVEFEEYDAATAYLDKSEAIVRVAGSVYDKQQLALLAFKLDTTQQDYKSAVAHLLRYKHLQDSSFTEIRAIELQKLEVQYETKKKEDQIKLLSQHQKLQNAELNRAEILRDGTIIGIVVVVVIAVLLYKQNKLKNKNNETLNHKNDVLQHLVTEKEWLLKEVHHRVKNNLHTINCLLEAQAAYLENDALKAIKNSQHRIFAMSLIHQKLYQSDDIKTIEMGIYIPELVQYLEDSFDTSNKVHFLLNIDNLNLNLTYAIPLGLIINEAVSNSIKYAFPGDTKGEIHISMHEDKFGVKLELADNGIGMSQNAYATQSGSLGLELMKGLSKDIKADITFEASQGTKITVLFKRDALKDADDVMSSVPIEEYINEH